MKQENSLFKERRYITLSIETINKLKELKEKTGKPISRIIEEKMKNEKKI